MLFPTFSIFYYLFGPGPACLRVTQAQIATTDAAAAVAAVVGGSPGLNAPAAPEPAISTPEAPPAETAAVEPCLTRGSVAHNVSTDNVVDHEASNHGSEGRLVPQVGGITGAACRGQVRARDVHHADAAVKTKAELNE